MSTALATTADVPYPARYSAAKVALAACVDMDECANMADQAAALAMYAKQAEDRALEDMAMRIRARAIRRMGELLNELPKEKGGRPAEKLGAAPPRVSPRQEAREKAGISEDQGKDAIRLANIPADEFESAVDSQYRCPVCLDYFGAAVWHCPDCDHHYDDDECGNCHRKKRASDKTASPPTITELAARGTQKKPAPLVDLNGRDPEEFNRAILVNGAIRDCAGMVCSVSAEAVLRGSMPMHYERMRDDASRLRDWLGDLLSLLESKCKA